MDHQPEQMDLHETPLAERHAIISARHTPSYSFGVATYE